VANADSWDSETGDDGLRNRSWRASRMTASDKSLASRASLSGMARGYTEPTKLGRRTGKRRIRVCGWKPAPTASRDRDRRVDGHNSATKPLARRPHLTQSCRDHGWHAVCARAPSLRAERHRWAHRAHNRGQHQAVRRCRERRRGPDHLRCSSRGLAHLGPLRVGDAGVLEHHRRTGARRIAARCPIAQYPTRGRGR
jgi:hypothetical protein